LQPPGRQTDSPKTRAGGRPAAAHHRATRHEATGPPDGRLRASFATRDLPVPLGISTGGYGQTPPADAPRSPFAEFFQATTTLVQPPRVQVLHVLKGDRRLLLAVADLIDRPPRCSQ